VGKKGARRLLVVFIVIVCECLLCQVILGEPTAVLVPTNLPFSHAILLLML
jgi:hypothetical protein